MGLLIDSTVLIDAERRTMGPREMLDELANELGDVEAAVSVMSMGELFHGVWRADSPGRRAKREEFVESILAAVPVVPITISVMRIFGEIDAKLTAKGRRVPASDLLIACTALSRGDEIVTANLRHFRSVPGLKVHELSAR